MLPTSFHCEKGESRRFARDTPRDSHHGIAETSPKFSCRSESPIEAKITGRVVYNVTSRVYTSVPKHVLRRTRAININVASRVFKLNVEDGLHMTDDRLQEITKAHHETAVIR
ncbi:hypothetical protein DPMN_175054 [Dreissena polymorpha]|uniref:Uncharacterized protein n=1 Tax=Dreissena polymorpha TaxID=45954 RepID=A0A9D4E5R5_DREPO|nr:hypothetical protein DPMN_175054 [Dreissena polymorpha]